MIGHFDQVVFLKVVEKWENRQRDVLALHLAFVEESLYKLSSFSYIDLE